MGDFVVAKKKEKDNKKHNNIIKKESNIEEESNIANHNNYDFKNIFSKLITFFSNQKIQIIVLLLIALFFAGWFRAYPYYLPITKDFAITTINNNFKAQISAQVNQQYPLLPQPDKEKIINEQLNNLLKTQKNLYDNQVLQLSNYFKSAMQDDKNQTYLLAIDPYYYLRRVRNLIDHGAEGDVKINGVWYNNHLKAPLLSPMNNDFHSWIGFYFFKVISLFNNNITPMQTQFWLPLIFSLLALIPLFFIIKRKTNLFGAFLATLLLGTHPSFLSRTMAGFADTDPYVVLFPILIIFFLIKSFYSKNNKELFIYSILAGLFATVFTFAWVSWYFISITFYSFLILLLLFSFYLILLKIEEKIFFKNLLSKFNFVRKKLIHIKKEKINYYLYLKRTFYIMISYLITNIITTKLFLDSNPFAFLTAPIKTVFSLKAVLGGELWPNVLRTVAELNAASIKTIISSLAPNFLLARILFIFALLGIALSLMPWKKERLKEKLILIIFFLYFLITTSNNFFNYSIITFLLIELIPFIILFFIYFFEENIIDFFYFFLLLIWFFASFFTVTKGIRFMLLLVTPFIVSLSIFLAFVYERLSSFLKKELVPSAFFSKAIIIIIILLLVSPIITAGKKTGYQAIPSMNDAWWSSLEKINKEASPNAIVNSWWDFGHWFKYVADRGVTFDGGSQGTPAAHWIGNTLLTNNETVAISNLRMLDCANYLGFKELLDNNIKYDSGIKNFLRNIYLFKKIILLKRDDAFELLKKEGLSDKKINNILDKTHCNPPENYFITSQDMIYKSGVWAHFGAWNFTKAGILRLYLINKDKDPYTIIHLLTDNFNLTVEDATNIYHQLLSLTDDNKRDAWVSPWPGYLTTDWVSCQYDNSEKTLSLFNNSNISNSNYSLINSSNNLVSCNLNLRIGSQNNVQLVITKALINKNKKEALFLLGSFDSNGRLLSELTTLKPEKLMLAYKNNYSIISFNNSGLKIGVLYDDINNKVLIADPLLLDSLFTKLFFLDGRYTTHFKKFSDKRSFKGERIIVWKVDWPEYYKNYTPFKHYFDTKYINN